MTVNAYITTTRVINGDGYFGLGFINEDDDLVNVWYVAISEPLSNKTENQIREILDIRSYGIWITTPLNNKYWVVSDLRTGFSIEEFDIVDLDYLQHEIEDRINTKMGEHNEDVSDFIDDLINALSE